MKLSKRVVVVSTLFIGIALGSVITLFIPKGLADTSISNGPISGDTAVQIAPVESAQTSVTVPSPVEETTAPTSVPSIAPTIIPSQQVQSSNTQTPSPCVR